MRFIIFFNCRVYWLAFLHTHFFKQTKDLLALGYEFLFRTFQAQFKGNNVRLPSSQILWQETFLVCFYPYCYTCDDCIINMDNTNSHMPLCLYRNNNKAFWNLENQLGDCLAHRMPFSTYNPSLQWSRKENQGVFSYKFPLQGSYGEKHLSHLVVGDSILYL